MGIKYYDHARSTRNIVSPIIQGIGDCIPESYGDDDTAITNLIKEDFAIVHMPDDRFKKLVDMSSKDSVRLRVSSQGRINDRCYRTDKGVKCLFLRIPHNHLDRNDWEIVIKTLSDSQTVDAIIKNRIPDNLQLYFGNAPTFNIIALAILCRWYIINWGNSKSLLQLEAGSAEHKEFHSVVNFLNTVYAYESDCISARFPELFLEIPEAVSKPNWWNIFDEGKSVKSILEDEMNKCGIKHGDFGNVLQMSHFIDSTSGSANILDINLALEAYREIKIQEARLSW